MRSFRPLAFLAAAVVATGCATTAKMPLQPIGKTPDLDAQGVLVARVRIRNAYKPGQQPVLESVLARKTVNGKVESFLFTDPTLLSDDKEGGKEYFASLAFGPGTIALDSAGFRRSIPLLLNASASAPFNVDVEVVPGKVTYLGRIEATIVEKTTDAQIAAGGPIPLIDQSVAGFSGGTFQYKVTDGFDEDVEVLKKKYRFLAKREFVKAILALPPAPGEAKKPAAPAPAAGAPQASL